MADWIGFKSLKNFALILLNNVYITIILSKFNNSIINIDFEVQPTSILFSDSTIFNVILFRMCNYICIILHHPLLRNINIIIFKLYKYRKSVSFILCFMNKLFIKVT